MAFLALIFLAFVPCVSFAQWQNGSWLSVAYTYNQIEYTETDKLKANGRLPGVHGEIGLKAWNWFGVSAAADYADGLLTYTGSSYVEENLKSFTDNHLSDYKGLGHLRLGILNLSSGVGQRYWYSDLQNSYSQKLNVQYVPVIVTLQYGSFYLKVEHDLVNRAQAQVFMSQHNSSRKDLTKIEIENGKGVSGELGLLIPSRYGALQVFVHYEKWNLSDAEPQNDGVSEIKIRESEMIIYRAGVGLMF